jgi:RNA exonuclease 1
LEANGYPTHSDDGSSPEGFVSLSKPATSEAQLFAIDCEMVDYSVSDDCLPQCETSAGPELARVTVVSVDGNVLLDRLVKPLVPIVDYKTQFVCVSRQPLMGQVQWHDRGEAA